ncbi:MAG TPA: acyl-CoA dehydrogenase family protein [Myxococcota bacterium]|jgi:alkylation response protein AidB-like acyl-CoA dehydrogenase|nr:acyl-CoA dehydrogenase family protein [Myxococcota bacterium]
MDLTDSPAEAAFRAEARTFLAEHAPAHKLDIYDEDQDEEALLQQSRAFQRTLHAHGWAAVLWPKQYGGRGCGPIEQIIWSQELGRAGIGESVFVVGIGMAGPTIIAHGSPEQKQRYLPPMLRGDEIWCQLFSEPGAGSDLAALATRAVRHVDEWIVNGQKVWCSGGHYADFGILLARTDPSAPKHKGITYFLLDMKTPGIEVRPLRQMNGSAHFSEVFLNDVRVPDAARLGPENAGWSAAMTTLLNERMAIGGIDRMFSLERFLEHVRSHRDRLDAAARDEVARIYVWARSLEMLNARVMTKLGRGALPAAESSVMKLAIARIVSRSSDLALRLLGPEALGRRGRWQNHWLYAPALHIAGGTDEIQKNIAAERVLGLPREAEPLRDVPFERLPRG